MKLPQKTAILGTEVAGPGLPVFDQAGCFAGLAQNSFGQNYLLFSRNQHGNPILLINVEESSVVLLAAEVLPYLGRVRVRSRVAPLLGSAFMGCRRWILKWPSCSSLKINRESS